MLLSNFSEGESNQQQKTIKTIGWRMGNFKNEHNQGNKVSVVGSLEFNIWNGKKSLQMILKDIK